MDLLSTKKEQLCYTNIMKP